MDSSANSIGYTNQYTLAAGPTWMNEQEKVSGSYSCNQPHSVFINSSGSVTTGPDRPSDERTVKDLIDDAGNVG